MIGRRLEMIHNEILIYIAYKEGMLNKDDYIDYLKSQMKEITDTKGDTNEDKKE